MTGSVSEGLRPQVDISVYPDPLAKVALNLGAWIDTGFEGDLVIPEVHLHGHAFQTLGSVPVTVASGRMERMDVFRGWISWFGVRRMATILGGGDVVLLGTDLLADRRLLVDFPKRLVTIS